MTAKLMHARDMPRRDLNRAEQIRFKKTSPVHLTRCDRRGRSRRFERNDRSRLEFKSCEPFWSWLGFRDHYAVTPVLIDPIARITEAIVFREREFGIARHESKL